VDLPRNFEKVHQQTHLKRAHMNLVATDEDLVRVGVDVEVADGDATLAGRR
jgi:hypothetical protein